MFIGGSLTDHQKRVFGDFAVTCHVGALECLFVMSTIIDITLLCRSVHCVPNEGRVISRLPTAPIPTVLRACMNDHDCMYVLSHCMAFMFSHRIAAPCLSHQSTMPLASQHHASRITAPCLSHRSISSISISSMHISMRSSMCSITAICHGLMRGHVHSATI